MIKERQSMKRTQIPELTGLRGLAVLLILINHMMLVAPMLGPMGFARSTLLCGISGMSLFFILSGIVIYYNYASLLEEHPAEGIKRFVFARFARMYPLYFVFIIGFFTWNAFHHPEQLPQNITSLPLFLAGMQTWIYGYIDGTELVYLQGNANISWAISTMFALYLLFVPATILLGKASIRKAFVVLLSAVVLQCIFAYCVCRVGWLTAWANKVFPGHSGAINIYLTYHSPLGRAFEFAAGCAIAMIYINKNEVAAAWGISLKCFSAAVWVLGVLCGVFVMRDAFPVWTNVLVSTSLIFLCAGLPYFGARIFRWRVLMFLGDISYSVYLLHIVFVIALYYDGCEKWAIARTICVFLAVTYFSAWVSFRWFESPARRFIRSCANQR